MTLGYLLEIPQLVRCVAATLFTQGSRHAGDAFIVGSSVVALVSASCQAPTNPEARGGWYQAQPGYANARPVLLDSLVIAGTASGTVIARSRTTGEIVWRTQVPVYLRIRGDRLVTSGSIVVVPVDYQTFGLDGRSGGVLWEFDAPIDSLDKEGPNLLPGSVLGVRAAADSETTYLPAWGGSVTALNSRTGSVHWQWMPTDSLPRRFGARGVAIDDDRVIVTLWHFLNTTGSRCEGWVVALNRRTGAQLWRTIVPSHGQGVCIFGGPAIASEHAVVATVDGFIYGLSAATGEIAWVRQPEVPASRVFNAILTGPLALDGLALVDGGDSEILAIRGSDGTLIRRSPYGGELGGQLKDDAFATSSRIYAPDGKYLYVFDRATGRFLKALMQPNNISNGLFPSAVVGDSIRVYAPVNGGMWAFLAPRVDR